VYGFVKRHQADRHIPKHIFEMCLVFYNEFGMCELFKLQKLLPNVDHYTSLRAFQVKKFVSNWNQIGAIEAADDHRDDLRRERIKLEPIGGQFIVVVLLKRVHIVHIASRRVTTLRISADSAIINPFGTLIGLRFNNALKIYNLNNMDVDEPIRTADGRDLHFWRWINEREIAFVRRNFVYRWDIDSDAGPVMKVNCGQGNYDINDKFPCIDCGVSPDGCLWYLQCRDVANGRTLRINYHPAAKHFNLRWSSWDASGACFANVTIKDKRNKIGLLRHRECLMDSYVHRPDPDRPDYAELCTFEFESYNYNTGQYNSNHPSGTPSKKYFLAHIPFPFFPEDVIAIVHACDGWIYVVIKQGFIFVYAHVGAAKTFSMRISQNEILYAAANSRTGGMVAIDSDGGVIECRVGEELLKAALQRRQDVMSALKLLELLSHLPRTQYLFQLEQFSDEDVIFLLQYFEIMFEKIQLADIDIIQREHGELYQELRECDCMNCLLQEVDERDWKENGGNFFRQDWPIGIHACGVDVEQMELLSRLLRALHCYLVHSIDIGMRIKVCEFDDWQNEMPTEVDMQFVHKILYKGYVVYVTQSRRRPKGLSI